LFYSKFKKAFGIDFEDHFEFYCQYPEGWDCRMTMLARETYEYKEKTTGKTLRITIDFDCNQLCDEIFFVQKRCGIYSLEGYKYYTPNIEKCKVKLYYGLQKNEAFNFGYDSLNDIKDGNIKKYLHQEKK
jgi:hypothetical protein